MPTDTFVILFRIFVWLRYYYVIVRLVNCAHLQKTAQMVYYVLLCSPVVLTRSVFYQYIFFNCSQSILKLQLVALKVHVNTTVAVFQLINVMTLQLVYV